LAPNNDVDPGINVATGDGRGPSSRLFGAPTTTRRRQQWDECRRRYDSQYSRGDGSAMQLQAQLREFVDDDDDAQ
jgi:hypothetical protein